MWQAALLSVAVCWFVLGVSVLFRRRTPAAREIGGSRAWTAGFILQSAAVVILLLFRRPWLTPLAPVGGSIVAIAAMALAVASILFMIRAQQALGRQFAFRARLVERHELVTSGPYAVVRHPIYTAFFGLSIATGLVLSDWRALPPFLVLFACGTAIRVRAEERLLRGAFGAEFDAYARRVPAFIPGLRRAASP